MVSPEPSAPQFRPVSKKLKGARRAPWNQEHRSPWVQTLHPGLGGEHRPGQVPAASWTPRLVETSSPAPKGGVQAGPCSLEGLGTGRVHGVQGWLRGVAGKGVDLHKDGQVHQHLQQAAHRELQGRTLQQKVGRLEGVTACPHGNHLDAEDTGQSERSGVRQNSMWGQAHHPHPLL